MAPSERAAWVSRLEASLPPRSAILERNAAITAHYARWYLAHPALFKWAGMAVVGSYKAGGYLRALRGETRIGRAMPASFRDAQLAIVKETNDCVFADIGWAHAALVADDGGIAAIERALDGEPHARGLIDGFRLLEEARRASGARADELAWQATRLLLEHEQGVTVQPFFGRYHPIFSGLVSLTATSDFRLGLREVIQRARPAFVPYMLRRGRATLRATGARWPDLTRFDHRWAWIEGEVLPCWRAVESSRQRPFLARVQAIADGHHRAPPAW